MDESTGQQLSRMRNEKRLAAYFEDRGHPAYKSNVTINGHGVAVLVMKFTSFSAMEEFFIDLVGSPIMRGSSSKVIGTTLMIWDTTKPERK